jgi:hypothetical protein
VNILSNSPDVTAPEDVVAAFGGTSPAAEQVENAFNNTTGKYLNFGSSTNGGFVGPVGLTVTLGTGSNVVSGIRFYTANDAPERDPVDFVLEGANDPEGTNFVQIASGPLNLPTARNASGLDLDPLTQANQEVNFSNSTAYSTYRITFDNVRNNATANSMQIGEIELLAGTGGSSTNGTRLTIAKNTNDNSVTIAWNGPGTLQSAPAVTGPWTDVGATNPTTVPITTTEQARFFRVRVSP